MIKDPQKLRDRLSNMIASLNGNNFTNMSRRYVSTTVTRDEQAIESLWRQSSVGQKIVNMIPNTGCANWRVFSSDDLTPEQITAIEKEEKRLNLKAHIRFAWAMSRAYGTAYILLAVDDGLSPEEPLDHANIKPGSLKHLKVLVGESEISTIDSMPTSDPFSENYGKPDYYTLGSATANAIRVHHTRVVRFDHTRLPILTLRAQNYIADSIFEHGNTAVDLYETALKSTVDMIKDSKNDIISIPNLQSKLTNERTQAEMLKRFQEMSILSSYNNLTLLDAQEEYQRVSHAFTGLDQVIEQCKFNVAMAFDIPASILFSQAHAGLNGGSESDLRTYNETVSRQRSDKVDSNLCLIDNIMLQSIGISNENLDFEWCSIESEMPEREANLQALRSNRDEVYLNNGVVTQHIVAKQLLADGTYSAGLTDEFVKELEDAFDFDEFANDDIDQNEDNSVDEEASKKDAKEA